MFGRNSELDLAGSDSEDKGVDVKGVKLITDAIQCNLQTICDFYLNAWLLDWRRVEVYQHYQRAYNTHLCAVGGKIKIE